MDQIVEKKDVSKQTIVVLVFLAILVSLLGTLTVMQEVSKVKTGETFVIPEGNSESSGEVSLTIVGPEARTSSSSGTVRMEIKSPV